MLLSFRRFLAAGGQPHRKMCEFTYRLCLKHFDFNAATQVLRAMRLMRGLQLREPLYRQLWDEAQQRMHSRWQSGGGGSGLSSSVSSGIDRDSGGGGGGGRVGSSSPAERLKWWLGLPNKYYRTDWR